jgi:multiple sugar transport system permease protein/putative aldouronate transport system permease protein
MSTDAIQATQNTAAVQEAIARARSHRKSRSRRAWESFHRNWQLYVMILPPFLWLIVYKYVPMWGVQIAFRDYTFRDGITGSEWVGLEHLERFVNSFNFWTILRNTLVLNLYSLIASFPLPIILALSLNSVRREWFKKTVQLISYAPHFISTVVIVGLVFQFVATEGFVNQILGLFGVNPINFMGEPAYWKSLYVWSGVWQGVGFGCIIYLAALAGIDPTLHEAAIIDGATRIQRMRDIDLPGILPVAIILLILNMGTLLNSGFEKVILMQNNLNKGTSEVIDSYVYNVGIAAPVPQWSYAASIGLFKSIIGLILLIAVNQLARRLKVASLW